MSTRVVLIRHAPTDTDSRLCGSFDVPLTPAGLAQVQALLRRSPTRPVPHVLYTSTLTRASDVAAALGRAWGLVPQVAEWAREIHCGEVEGVPLAQLQCQYTELWARHQAQNDDSFAWPRGESYRDFRARVLSGLKAVTTAHVGRRLAVITHAGVISQVLGAIRHRPASVWAVDRPDPFTATEIAWIGGAPTAVITYNDPDWY